MAREGENNWVLSDEEDWQSPTWDDLDANYYHDADARGDEEWLEDHKD